MRHNVYAVLVAVLALSATAPAQPRAKDGEWSTYAADLAGSRYRPLDQIDATNFNKLEVAWRFKTDSLGNRPEYKLEGTPLMVDGVVYATAGSRRAAIALDAATGELLWVHGEHEGARGAAAPRQLSGRGLAYWTDGKVARILYVTPGYRLISLDAKTGQRKWHFQLVHHPLWDMDISSAPILADISVDGRPVKAVAQPTKQGFLYVLDRVSGKPVWPIPEQAVEKGNVPGEWYSPTQPIPSKPRAYSRNGVFIEDLIDFTPALHDAALTLVAKYKLGPVYTPPVASKVAGPLATLTMGTASGGTNWPGASYDPETHTVYAYACNACVTPIGLLPSPKEISDMNYIAGTAGQEVVFRMGPGENAGADSPLPARSAAPRTGGGGGLNIRQEVIRAVAHSPLSSRLTVS